MESARPAHQRGIRRRLLTGVAVIVIIAIGAISAVASQIAASTAATDRSIRSSEQLQRAIADLVEAIDEQDHAIAKYRLNQVDESLDAHRRAVADQARAEVTIVAAAEGDPAILKAAAAATAAIAVWRAEWADPTMALLQATGRAPSNAATEVALFGDVQATLGELQLLSEARQSAAHGQIESMGSTIILTLAIAGAVAAALVVGVGLWLVHTISRPLDRLIATAERVRSGDSVPFLVTRDDEIGVLAATLEKLRLDLEDRYDEARRDGAQAATFNRLSELMTFAASEPELVDAAVVTLGRLVPSDRGELALLNPSLDRLVVASSWGNEAADRGAMVDVDRPDRCPGIRRGSVYVAADVTDPMVLRCPAHPASAGSVMCVPLLATGDTVGVVHLARPVPDAFDMDAQRLGLRIAEQAALALANARLMRTMESLAMTDPLTKLRNARFFDPLLERELAVADRDGSAVGLLAIDLDHFKQFNDAHGHPAGDEALKAFASTLIGVVRGADTVARYGGEEFVVALPGADVNAAAVVAEKIREAVDRLIIEIGPGRYARLTASIGVSSTSAHGYERMTLLREADQALYRAKRGGRNRVEVATAVTGRRQRTASSPAARAARRGTTKVAASSDSDMRGKLEVVQGS